jgi:hypothetical protein
MLRWERWERWKARGEICMGWKCETVFGEVDLLSRPGPREIGGCRADDDDDDDGIWGIRY